MKYNPFWFTVGNLLINISNFIRSFSKPILFISKIIGDLGSEINYRNTFSEGWEERYDEKYGEEIK